MKNLAKAAKRIKEAIKNKERIILYGDADLDGVTSVIIVKETILNLGGKVNALYFPDREKEGYGINFTALAKLKKYAPALLIAMDLGITNVKEVDVAKKRGFSVILLDHHKVIGTLPNAEVIVNPHQKGEWHSFKGFAACGISLKLALVLLGKTGSPALKASLTELAALGTIADMMPREQDNKEIIEEGLRHIQETWRPGLKVFFETPEFAARNNLFSKVGYMISVLNVRDIEDQLPGAYRLLTTVDEKQAKTLLTSLEEKNKIRREKIRGIVQEVELIIKAKTELPFIFEGDTSFDYVLLGSAASILSNTHKKPVFLYKRKRGESIGSARAPAGFDTVEAMEHCSKLLVTFGGHPPASGFRVKTKNVEKFKTCLVNYFALNKNSRS